MTSLELGAATKKSPPLQAVRRYPDSNLMGESLLFAAVCFSDASWQLVIARRRSSWGSNGCSFASVQDVKLSPEVEPFIPQRKGFEGSLVSMSLSGEAGGGGGGGAGIGGGSGGVEAAPIPSYLITCYPFVQENQPNRYRAAFTMGGEKAPEHIFHFYYLMSKLYKP